MFRALRISILLLVLIAVAGGTWLTKMRTTSWERPLRVAVFPINADGSAATGQYIRSLSRDSFVPIAEFMKQEAARFGLRLSAPVEMFLAPEIKSTPPPPPFGAGAPQVLLWSLKMRWWAFREGDFDRPKPHARMFVLYFDPEKSQRVAHSLGLQKGLIGVVNAFASEAQASQNNVILAHELLHTVGATDKYDPATNQPVNPDGFAEPNRQPLYPQEWAEIMGGRVPLSATDSEIPHSLKEVVVGAATAREINWVR